MRKVTPCLRCPGTSWRRAPWFQATLIRHCTTPHSLLWGCTGTWADTFTRKIVHLARIHSLKTTLRTDMNQTDWIKARRPLPLPECATAPGRPFSPPPFSGSHNRTCRRAALRSSPRSSGKNSPSELCWVGEDPLLACAVLPVDGRNAAPLSRTPPPATERGGRDTEGEAQSLAPVLSGK